MRVIFLLASLLFATAANVRSFADVIHLKNGRKIWADHVRENGNRVEYDVGDDSYKISKSSVDSIEAGGLPHPTRLLRTPRMRPRTCPHSFPRTAWQGTRI